MSSKNFFTAEYGFSYSSTLPFLYACKAWQLRLAQMNRQTSQHHSQRLEGLCQCQDQDRRNHGDKALRQTVRHFPEADRSAERKKAHVD